jgi:hypothetical protein
MTCCFDMSAVVSVNGVIAARSAAAESLDARRSAR